MFKCGFGGAGMLGSTTLDEGSTLSVASGRVEAERIEGEEHAGLSISQAASRA